MKTRDFRRNASRFAIAWMENSLQHRPSAEDESPVDSAAPLAGHVCQTCLPTTRLASEPAK